MVMSALITTRMIGACVFLAANTYHVPPAALMGIYQIEGGRLGQEVPNRNGSFDMGPMQINSSWLPLLSRKWGVSGETARRLVRDDACTNVGVAAWIVKGELERTGNIAQAIADYHSHTAPIGRQYRGQVVGRIARYQLAAPE